MVHPYTIPIAMTAAYIVFRLTKRRGWFAGVREEIHIVPDPKEAKRCNLPIIGHLFKIKYGHAFCYVVEREDYQKNYREYWRKWGMN